MSRKRCRTNSRQATKRITELQADNAKLREALRAIVEHKMLGIDPGVPSWREKIEAARAALSQEEKP